MANRKNMILMAVGIIAIAASILLAYGYLVTPAPEVSVPNSNDSGPTDTAGKKDSGIADTAGQQTLQEGVSIKNGTIFFADEEKGYVKDGKLSLRLGDGYMSFAGDPSKISFYPFESSGFYYDDLEVSDQAACPYQICDFGSKVSYACDGPLVRKEEWLPASSAYCETDGSAFLSQYEFSAANGNGFTTGGESSYGWYRLYLKRWGGTDLYFFGNLGETLDYGDTDRERVDRLSGKGYLDELMREEDNKRKIARWDEFVRSVEFENGEAAGAN